MDELASTSPHPARLISLLTENGLTNVGRLGHDGGRPRIAIGIASDRVTTTVGEPYILCSLPAFMDQVGLQTSLPKLPKAHWHVCTCELESSHKSIRAT